VARVRTFVAIDLSAETRRAARQVIGTLSSLTNAIRWVTADNLHLTLKFLGDVEDRDIYQVCRQVAHAAAALAPFTVECRGVGAFPSVVRPRTIWLGVPDPQGAVVELQAAIEQRLSEIGVPREFRPFQPHITLGRVGQVDRDVAELSARLPHFHDLPAGALVVEECVVYASELTPRGPIYTAMGRLRLGATEA